MQHLDFIVWMLGYPLVTSTTRLISSYVKDRPAPKPDLITPFVLLGIYFGIGILLW
jgi:hypothetical protein